MNQTQATNRIKIAWRLERMPKSSYILFLGSILITAYFIEAIDNGAIGYFLPILKNEFNISPAMLGYVGTISNVGVMFGAMVSGFVSDIIGRKWFSLLLWLYLDFSEYCLLMHILLILS